MRLYILLLLAIGLIACSQEKQQVDKDPKRSEPQAQQENKRDGQTNVPNANATTSTENKPKPRPNIKLIPAKPFLESGKYYIQKGDENALHVKARGNHVVGNYYPKDKSSCALVFSGTIDGDTQTAKIKAKCAGQGNMTIKDKSIVLIFEKNPCGECTEDYTKGVTLTLFD